MNSERKNKRGPTIEDVAREARVSQTTVSYVLSNSVHALRISSATKERILAAARRLGYSRNYIGAALQRGYSTAIVILVVTWDLAAGHTRTIAATSQAAAAYGLHTIVHVAESDAEANRFLQDLPSLLPYGLLLLWDSLAVPVDLLHEYQALGLPIVDLMPLSPGGFISITANREMAGYLSTRHLLQMGHRKIAMMLDTHSRWRTSNHKMAGYCRALEEAGIDFDETLLEEATSFGFDAGRDGLPHLLARRPDVTAVICINDPMALGVLAGAQNVGIRVPDDLSVIGYAATQEGTYFKPYITSVAVDSVKIAKDAVRTLVRLREGDQTIPKEFYEPVELIVRESTAPPRSQELLQLG
jgi:LacI family transcriptional regulator